MDSVLHNVFASSIATLMLFGAYTWLGSTVAIFIFVWVVLFFLYHIMGFLITSHINQRAMLDIVYDKIDDNQKVKK